MAIDARYRTIDAFNALVNARAEQAGYEYARLAKSMQQTDEARLALEVARSDFDESRAALAALDTLLTWLDWQPMVVK